VSESVTSRLSGILALPNDSIKKTFVVALLLSLVSSMLVSLSAVVLRPLQVENASLDRQRNILAAAGLLDEGTDISDAFSRIEARVVDLDSGQFSDDIDAESLDERRAARDPATSVALSKKQDIAAIGRRSRYATVYLVKDGDAVEAIILPIYGYGLWSTLYGFIALEPDLNTVVGLTYYEHAETAGLGAEVDNPAWLSQWKGRRVFDESGAPVLRAAKGRSTATGDAAFYEVDGLAGATLTSNGVTNMLHFWLGEQGFGPFLENRQKRIGSS
jgi:Na+-transporting NADH:ubiquinone oxidoreductase subunit C